MSQRTRNIVTIGLTVLMAATSFVAGYSVRAYVDRITNPGVALAAGDPDIELYWEAWQYVQDSYVGEPPNSKARTYGAIRGSLDVLADPYTLFVEPQVRQEERDNLRGNFGGIGADLRRNEAGEVVLTPLPNNPAAMAGVQDGDILIEVDGVAVAPDQTVGAIADLIRGERGTTVVLTLRRGQATELLTIEIERDEILIPSVWHRLLETDPTIGYIQLSRFSGESNDEVVAAVDALRDLGADKLVLDLRHNPGGLLDAAVAVADQFLDEGLILRQMSREEEREFSATAGGAALDMPVVVLVDGATASAAEIVAGALQVLDRALLVGSRTFGKGSVQLIFDLSDGSSVHVTSAKWLTPDGTQLDGQGLMPDIEVTASQEALDLGRDEVLERAVDALRTGE